MDGLTTRHAAAFFRARGLGDEMYPLMLANAVHDGHLEKAEQQLAIHKLVAATGASVA